MSGLRGLERLSLAACAALSCGMAAAGPAADAALGMHDALLRDSEVTLHLRSYYFDRHSPGGAVSAAWAAGGWLGYRSGWLGELVRFGIVGYTSQPIWAPSDSGGTGLLQPDQDPISVIGQAYASLKLGDQVLSGGRFEVRQPEVNPNDVRMLPNTFEGLNLNGRVAAVNFYVAYLNAMKTIASDHFDDFAAVAGAPVGVSAPLWLIGFDGKPQPGASWRLSAYHVPDILDSMYADGAWQTSLSHGYALRLGAQLMAQRSNGSDALTGSAFSTAVGGVRADLTHGGATATLAYNQTADGANWRYPYGVWEGYTSMIVLSFNRAHERAWLVGGNYDFAAQGLPGLTINANIVFGSGAIDPAAGTPLQNNTEYDLTVDYRFQAARWPAWARPLWLRARAAYVDQGAAGNISDYRIIVNYPMSW